MVSIKIILADWITPTEVELLVYRLGSKPAQFDTLNHAYTALIKTEKTNYRHSFFQNAQQLSATFLATFLFFLYRQTYNPLYKTADLQPYKN